MLISGLWFLCDDGAVRPVLQGHILAADGAWHLVKFLLDTGADRTVISTDILRLLGLTEEVAQNQFAGVGGQAPSVVIDTQVRFATPPSSVAVFHGKFAAFTDPASLDMSVLGRDITDLFAIIVDRPQDVVCLLGQNHTYQIIER